MGYTINIFTGRHDYYKNDSDWTISNATVIDAITTETNWVDGSFVDPGGILAQITAGQYYLDTTNKILYQYIGTTLIRMAVNNLA